MKGDKKKSTVELLEEVAAPIAEQYGVYLWDVRFEKEGASWFARIIIDTDKEGGITLDDCADVSRAISDILDERDFIEQSYYLEVSSPGIMRELRKAEHFECCIGDEILVKLIRPIDNVREFCGVLKSYSGGKFILEVDDRELEFEQKACSYVKLNDDIDMSNL